MGSHKTKLERKDCVVMNSSSRSKKSYHIVINCGVYFKHRSDNEAFVKNIKRYDPTLEYLDGNVYTKNRNMRMINQSKVDKGIMLKMESMHFMKDTLIHNYNPSMISEIFEIKVDDELLGEEESDYSQMQTNHIEYTEEEIIKLCSLLNYERGEYNDWIKIGTALKNGGYDWSVFEEVSKNLKNYDSMCNFKWKFRSLDESRGNLGTIVNMVKEDNPEEYYEWKMQRRPSLLLMSMNNETNEENNETLDCENEESIDVNETDEYHFDHFFEEFKDKSFKKRTDYLTNFLPKYNQVFHHFTDHNEIVYKSRDGYVVGKPNTNVIRHVVKGKVVKFDDIASGYTSHIHFYHDFGFYPDHKDSHGHDCPPNMLNIWNGFQGQFLEYDMNAIEPILHHIRTCWANDNEGIYDYILNWLAHIVQYPYKKTKGYQYDTEHHLCSS